VLTDPPRRRSPLLVVAIVLAVAAAGFLAWSVASLVSAGTDVDHARDHLTAARAHLDDVRDQGGAAIRTARDQALAAGQEAVAVMNTLDYREIDADLDRWERVTTGALHDEVVTSRAQSKKAVEDAKSVTKAQVLSAAVAAVDEHSATVLVALKVNVSVAGAEPTDKYMRLRGTLARTGSAWQLDGIEQVAYGS
jgi:Mce-associated membrane protein